MNAIPRNVVFPLLLTSTLPRNPVFGGDLVLAVLCDLCSAGTPGQCGTPALVTTVKEAAKMQQTDTQTQFHGDVDIIIRVSLSADGMGTILMTCNV